MRSLLLFLAACGASAATPPVPMPRQPATPPAARPLFELHSSFWVNLHERLYAESDPRVPSSDPSSEAWATAIEAYRRRYPDRSLGGLFSDELVALRARLDAAGEDETPAGIDPELAAAATAYRAGAWREDDTRNRAWISRVTRRLEIVGPTLAADHARAYATPWPSQPIRVEVSAYAGPVGAFTSVDPTRIAVGASDPRYQDDAAVEMLFHEASHGLIRRIEHGLEAAAARLGKPAPPRLWHALIFFTSGELAARRLPPGYLPYARKNGLYERSPEMAAYEEAMLREWVPYLDGKVGLDAALEKLIGAL
jgi:hypothetical protein